VSRNLAPSGTWAVLITDTARPIVCSPWFMPSLTGILLEVGTVRRIARTDW
jgi:hypothetical protein